MADRVHIRQMMVVPWQIVAGPLLPEVIKESYKVVDRSASFPNIATVGVASIFLVKQIADCFLYYSQLQVYDPQVSQSTVARYIRFLFENTIEIFVLFLIYGSIHRINV